MNKIIINMKKIIMICCLTVICLTAATAAPAIKDIRVENSQVVLDGISYPVEKVNEFKSAQYAYVFEVSRSGGSDWATVFSYADGTFGISYEGFNAFFNNEEVTFTTYQELTKKEFLGEDGTAGWSTCVQPWKNDTKVKYVFSHKDNKAYIIVFGI